MLRLIVVTCDHKIISHICHLHIIQYFPNFPVISQIKTCIRDIIGGNIIFEYISYKQIVIIQHPLRKDNFKELISMIRELNAASAAFT